MNTAVINIKTNTKVKAQAKKIASELGFSLSALINGYLNQLIRTKTVHFSTTEEKPSEFMVQALRNQKKMEKLVGTNLLIQQMKVGYSHWC